GGTQRGVACRTGETLGRRSGEDPGRRAGPVGAGPGSKGNRGAGGGSVTALVDIMLIIEHLAGGLASAPRPAVSGARYRSGRGIHQGTRVDRRVRRLG